MHSQVASPDNNGSSIRLGTAGHLSPVGSGGVGLVGSSRRHHSGGAGSGQSEFFGGWMVNLTTCAQLVACKSEVTSTQGRLILNRGRPGL